MNWNQLYPPQSIPTPLSPPSPFLPSLPLPPPPSITPSSSLTTHNTQPTPTQARQQKKQEDTKELRNKRVTETESANAHRCQAQETLKRLHSHTKRTHTHTHTHTSTRAHEHTKALTLSQHHRGHTYISHTHTHTHCNGARSAPTHLHLCPPRRIRCRRQNLHASPCASLQVARSSEGLRVQGRREAGEAAGQGGQWVQASTVSGMPRAAPHQARVPPTRLHPDRGPHVTHVSMGPYPAQHAAPRPAANLRHRTRPVGRPQVFPPRARQGEGARAGAHARVPPQPERLWRCCSTRGPGSEPDLPPLPNACQALVPARSARGC